MFWICLLFNIGLGHLRIVVISFLFIHQAILIIDSIRVLKTIRSLHLMVKARWNESLAVQPVGNPAQLMALLLSFFAATEGQAPIIELLKSVHQLRATEHVPYLRHVPQPAQMQNIVIIRVFAENAEELGLCLVFFQLNVRLV